MMIQKLKGLIFTWIGFLLVGCSGFNGIRTPLYDEEPVEPDLEAIEIYQQSREIVGEEKDYYFRYPFSEEINEPSLSYSNIETQLLTEGTFKVGEDIPAGRVSLLGNESVFQRENSEIHVGNMIIRDSAGIIYFENLFHSEYGQLVAQVDFRAGHTIEIIGQDTEVTVFYTESFPKDPYVLMNPPELLVNLDRLKVIQPLQTDDATQTVWLTAGIFEVGKHLEPGTYEMRTVQAPHNTELFHFRTDEEPRVYELILSEVNEVENADEEETKQHYPMIHLEREDKIYLSLVHSLELKKVAE